jgi:hypothetical protein
MIVHRHLPRRNEESVRELERDHGYEALGLESGSVGIEPQISLILPRDDISLVAPHLTVVVTAPTAQSRLTSLVSGGHAFWVASIAESERDTRVTHVHSNTGA